MLCSQHETLENINFEEQMKQINICALGPLRVNAALLKAGLIRGSIIIITSQAGSVEWRFTQNPSGGDYVRAPPSHNGVWHMVAEHLRTRARYLR